MRTIATLFFLVPLILFSFDKRGTTAASWLKIGVGRAIGMGDAFVALADDATATFYNPSGLANLNRRTIFLNHTDWFYDINHDYLSACIPAGVIGNFGFSVTALTMGSMEETKIDSFGTPKREDEGTGIMFSAGGLAAGVSFARWFTDKLSVGFGVKGLQERIWDVSAFGFAFDMGVYYNTGFRNLRVGMAINNFGPEISFVGGRLRQIEKDPLTGKEIPISLVSTPVPIPTTFRFGIAIDLTNTEASRLTSCFDLVHYNDINETFNIGLEYTLLKIFSLRAGYVLNLDQKYFDQIKGQTGLSGGASFATKFPNGVGFNLDYNYRHHAYLLGTHRIGLGFAF